MSNRIKQVNELIKREVSQAILKEADFPPDVLVTVTRADTSPDLRQTKVYVSVIPESSTKKVLAVLNREIYELQQRINKRLNMRPVPRLRFIEEKNIQEAARIERLLEDLKDE